ncbi:MAG: hypothetical protein GX175_02100 [Halanaerobiaceae bacterium]|jgi:hypothetical protein|nr:hypothetical protein [Halanaerobiaceae bacterium]
MKKLSVLGLVLIMVFGLSVLSFAAQGSLENGAVVSDSIGVSATVGKYAQILTGDTSVDFVLLGAAGETAEDNENFFTVESNCLIDLTFSADPLTNFVDYIKVVYELFQGEDLLLTYGTDAEGLADDPQTLIQIQDYKDGIVTYNIAALAELGSISDQAAGDYNATIYLTVAASDSIYVTSLR